MVYWTGLELIEAWKIIIIISPKIHVRSFIYKDTSNFDVWNVECNNILCFNHRGYLFNTHWTPLMHVSVYTTPIPADLSQPSDAMTVKLQSMRQYAIVEGYLKTMLHCTLLCFYHTVLCFSYSLMRWLVKDAAGQQRYIPLAVPATNISTEDIPVHATGRSQAFVLVLTALLGSLLRPSP